MTRHNARLRRWRAGFVVPLAAVALAGCAAGGGTTTVIETQAPSRAASNDAPPSAMSAASSGHGAGRARPLIFHGTGQKDLGTITVPADSTISWNCPSCGSTNFIINNANSDASSIPTNGLNQTQGVDPIPAGSYHTVVVDTTGGPWTIAVGGTAPAPSESSAPAPASDSGASVPTSTPPPAQDSATTQCDPNISVSAASCTFAENTFYEYWDSQGATSVSVYDPADHGHHTVTCSTDSGITCTADQGATVRFSQAAIDAYSQDQADGYARSGKLGP